jgi:hypothetical protein
VRKVAPSVRALTTEVEALRAFGDARAVRILEVNVGERSMLLERVTPGTTLAASATEAEALAVVATLLGAGWPAVPPASVATPIEGFLDELDALPFARARAM